MAQRTGLGDHATCRLQRALARAPLHAEMRPAARWWRLMGDSIVEGTSAVLRGGSAQAEVSAKASDEAAEEAAEEAQAEAEAEAEAEVEALEKTLPAARDMMDALKVAESEMRRRGVCANRERPVVLAGPEGAASLVGACHRRHRRLGWPRTRGAPKDKDTLRWRRWR